jgi:hypothetical protein
MQGEEVRLLQELLRAAGHDVEPDGIFGPRTERALMKFQDEHGFPPDGVAGPRTWDALRSGPPEPPPKQRPTPPVDEVKHGPEPERVRPPVGDLALSTSLGILTGWFADPVDAWAIVDRILVTHPNYLARSKARVQLRAPKGAAQRSMDEWLLSVRELIDLELVPELHTRQVLRGLALLEPELGRRLERIGVMEVVREKPLGRDGILSEAGRALLGAPERARSAPTLLDRPANEDRLGREVFAITLAARLVQLRGAFVPARVPWGERLVALVGRDTSADETPEVIDGPFLVHLQGAWGAGKSTLLNFFARELRSPSKRLQDAVWGPTWPTRLRLDRWVVVPFNAWQHQRIAPPWWWLMTALYQEGARELRSVSHREWLRFKLRDYAWRFKTRWPAFVVPVVAVAAVAVLVWVLTTRTSAFTATGDKTLIEFLGSVAGALTAVVGLVAAGWGAVRGVKRWMLVGTARGADQFMKTTADPMAVVQRRYEHLVESLGHPVAVFIDDLDRCKAAYVVELLEGIQTLFARAPVTYVVAADSCWLRESFLQVYEPFATSDTGPGPMLGYGFLDKSFQLSTSVPRMRPDSRSAYLASLLGAGRIEADRERARQRVASVESYEQLRQVVADSTDLSEAERRAVREEAALRAAGADIVVETHHLLQDFEDLLDPNPRAMKRLVNAYGFESRLRLLESDWIEEDLAASQKLALWTIVKLRWPALGDYLTNHPEQVAKVGPKTPLGSIPVGLRPYFRDADVRRVVSGEAADLDVRLDADSLQAMVRPAPVLVPPS